MAKRFFSIGLACLTFLIFAICGSGCSPEEGKEPVTDRPAATEVPEADSQKPVEAVEPETAAPASDTDTPETQQESAATIAEEPDRVTSDKTIPAEIVMVQEIWETPTKSAVKFTHENHIKIHKINCNECHHIYEDGKNVWDDSMPAARCETCHNEPTVKGEKQLPPEDQKRNLKLAFHNNCRGCHKEVKKENPETKAPLKCSECHKKKE